MGVLGLLVTAFLIFGSGAIAKFLKSLIGATGLAATIRAKGKLTFASVFKRFGDVVSNPVSCSGSMGLNHYHYTATIGRYRTNLNSDSNTARVAAENSPLSAIAAFR